MNVECRSGPLDGVTFTTTHPHLGFLWVKQERGGYRAYRAPRRGAELYVAAHLTRAREGVAVSMYDYAALTHALCESCGSFYRRGRRNRCPLRCEVE